MQLGASMIKATHPQSRADRRRLKEYHEKKKLKGGAKRREEVRDEETKDELYTYRAGDIGLD